MGENDNELIERFWDEGDIYVGIPCDTWFWQPMLIKKIKED